jgi:pilus assembly protein CpaF
VNTDDPNLLRAGSRAISLNGLVERVEAQFAAETAGRADLLADQPDAGRATLLRQVIEYVLAIESVKLHLGEREQLFRAAWDALFTLGPLEPYLADENTDAIQINGADRLFIRAHGGAFRPADLRFRDAAEVERILDRALIGTGLRLADAPFLEVGLTLAGRPARLTISGPPASPTLNVDIRLHPRAAWSLDMLIGRRMIDGPTADTLRVALAGRRGLMLCGDVDCGKTALLGALIATIGLTAAQNALVQRAGELRAPQGWQTYTAERAAFGGQVEAALASLLTAGGGGWLALDEVRFDEGAALWSALTAPSGPALLWTVRAARQPNRLRAALSMALRRGGAEGALLAETVAARLPLAVMLDRHDGLPRVTAVLRWAAVGEELQLTPAL